MDVYHDSEKSIVGVHIRIHGANPSQHTITRIITKNTEVIPPDVITEIFEWILSTVSGKKLNVEKIVLEEYHVILIRDYCGAFKSKELPII